MSDRYTMAKDREGSSKSYVGDGVYAVYDGCGVWLTAENGAMVTDAIYLEPEVFVSLVALVSGWMKEEK